ncbi:MAG: hypothetical protein R2699_09325 [Acidimicrobiales bacterium]
MIIRLPLSLRFSVRASDRLTARERHAVLGVPGLEVRVPGELPAPEPGLAVHPALEDGDVRAEELAHRRLHGRVGEQLGEALGQDVELEHGADLAAARLEDQALVAGERRVGGEAIDLAQQRRHLVTVDQLVERQVARRGEPGERRLVERTVVDGAPHDRVGARQPRRLGRDA